MKVKSPLFSLTAKGSLDKTITYSRRWQKDYVRKFVKPLKPASAGQASQRASFKSIIAEWNALTANERIGWLDIAYQLPPLSGYNIFLHVPAKRRTVHLFGNAKFGERVFGSPRAK